jgi:hypothetical protein
MIFSLTTAAERSRRHAARENELRRANAELKDLAAAMNDLDDEATPAIMLVYALRLSETFTSPIFASFVRDQLRDDPQFFEAASDTTETTDDESELAAALQQTLHSRPDLAIAFVRTFRAAISAFAARWPECSAYVEPLRTQILTHPATEARRVIRTSNRRPGGDRLPTAMPGAAAA